MTGPAAIPRSNGEPVFGAPWQSRAFGMAIVLHEQGAFRWEDFRRHLIREIGRAEQGEPQAEDPDGSLYYSRWLAALAAVLDAGGTVPEPELAGRSREYLTGARDDVH